MPTTGESSMPAETARPQVAQATPATASPSQTSTHPFVGILGVFVGGGIATLNGRLIGVGLPDLRGALGLDFDRAAWIPGG